MTLNIHDTDAIGALRRGAESARAMIYRRAVIAYWRAMGSAKVPQADATLNMCHMHNSMVSFSQGKPWREIDYSAMRLAMRIADQTFEPSRILNSLIERRIRETYRKA